MSRNFFRFAIGRIFVFSAFAVWLVTARSALAATTCPTIDSPPYSSLLHFEGYDANRFNTVPTKVVIGNLDFFGTTAVAALIVENPGTGTETCGAYLVMDVQRHLLGWLSSAYNHVCYGSKMQKGDVVSEAHAVSYYSSYCVGTAVMHPLNYSGNTLVHYLLDGSDHIHGGAVGYDIIYGGLGNDDLDEQGYTLAGTPFGDSYGEEGNDFLYGGVGNLTYLRGGPGIDGLYDAGGSSDMLYGDSGNECCMGDEGHTFYRLDCGSGTDTVDLMTGTIGCETVWGICNDGPSVSACVQGTP
jgi:hypothetical protein